MHAIKTMQQRFGKDYQIIEKIGIANYLVNHKTCKKTFPIRSDNFFNQETPCPSCRKEARIAEKKQLTIEKFTRTYPNYIIEDKVGWTLTAIHRTCGRQFSVSEKNFKKYDDPCPHCRKKAKLKEKEDTIKEMLLTKFMGEFELAAPIQYSSQHLEIKHTVCNSITLYKIEKGSIFKGNCIHCSPNHLAKFEKVSAEVETLTEEYSLVSASHGMNYLLLKHLKCGDSFKSKRDDFFVEKIGCVSCSHVLEEKKETLETIYHDKFEEKYGESYQMLSIEEGTVHVLHLTCNQRHPVTKQKLLHKEVGCPSCTKKTKLIAKFQNKFPDFTLLEASEDGCVFTHDMCKQVGQSDKSTLNFKTNDTLCIGCNSKIKKQRMVEKQKRRIAEMYGGDYEVISDITGYQDRITLNHTVCGLSFGTTLNEFFNKGAICSNCSGHRIPKERFMNQFQEKFGQEYSLMNNIDVVSRDVTVKHHVCGKETTKELYFFIKQKNPCNFCGNRLKKKEELDEKLSCIENGQYIALGEFKNVSTLMDFQHLSCGRIYPVSPAGFLANRRGTRCPTCFSKRVGRKRKANSEQPTNN